jgi:hypothetical protein
MEVFLAGVESRPFVLIDWYAEGRKEVRKCNYIWRGGYRLT